MTRIVFLVGLILLACQASYATTDPCSEKGNTWPAAKLGKVAPTTYFILATAANGNMDVPKSDQLELANNDAQVFAETMQKYFTPAVVCLLRNVSAAEYESALRHLAELVRVDEDKVFIYFSGHGMIEPSDNCEEGKKNTDCKENDCVDEGLVTSYQESAEPKRVRDHKFVELVSKIKTTRPITIFLDTCFAGGMVRGETDDKALFKGAKPKNFVKEGSREHLPSRKCPVNGKFEQLQGSILYAASQESQLAWEYKGRGGIFTRIFLQKLEEEELKRHAKWPIDDQFLDEVFKATAKEVKETTKNSNYYQEPQRWGNVDK